MKLFVIVLCLLSERYLVHALSHHRFTWFENYYAVLVNKLGIQNSVTISQQALLLAVIILPILILTWLVFFTLGFLIFGLVGLLLNVLIFFYCLGPQNPFYPIRVHQEELDNELLVANYFAQVNRSLFAIIFWYIVTGPVGILFYRLLSLFKEESQAYPLAQKILDVLDWIPARITTFLYLLVGNFQLGINFYKEYFLKSPKENFNLLSQGGLLAAKTNGDERIPLPYAENIVVHALMVFLLLIALFTLVSWL